jgi:hypothetical protein
MLLRQARRPGEGLARRLSRTGVSRLVGMARKTATGDEAAAVAAAIQQFVAETAAPAAVEGERVNPWQRAALVEGVSAKGTVQDLQGGSQWLS